MAYITQQDLVNAMGLNVVKAVFCDDNTDVPNASAIAACLAYASAQVDAFLAGTYDVTLPLVSPPDIVKFAAVDFACGYAMRRRPDIVRAMNEKSWSDFQDAALTNMKLFAVALKRLPQSTVSAPANVGGFSLSTGGRLVIDNVDGTSNAGDF